MSDKLSSQAKDFADKLQNVEKIKTGLLSEGSSKSGMSIQFSEPTKVSSLFQARLHTLALGSELKAIVDVADFLVLKNATLSWRVNRLHKDSTIAASVSGKVRESIKDRPLSWHQDGPPYAALASQEPRENQTYFGYGYNGRGPLFGSAEQVRSDIANSTAVFALPWGDEPQVAVFSNRGRVFHATDGGRGPVKTFRMAK